MKENLLKSALFVLFSMTTCYGASGEEPTPSGRQKRPVSPMEVDDLSFLPSHAGGGFGDERVGCLQRKMSVYNSGSSFSRLLLRDPIGTYGLGHKSKKSHKDLDPASSTGATGSIKDGIPPALPLSYDEEHPSLEKVTSVEVGSKEVVPKPNAKNKKRDHPKKDQK
jgi:hypothetical protein